MCTATYVIKEKLKKENDPNLFHCFLSLPEEVGAASNSVVGIVLQGLLAAVIL